MRRLASLVVAALLALAPRPAAAQTNALWFPVGEETIYQLNWGVLPVGQTHVTTAWTNHAGKTVLAIRYVTRTNKVVEKLYPVDIFMETLIDADTFLPIRFIKRAREGRHRSDEETHFDYARGVARWKSLLKNKEKEIAIDDDTRDLVALMYYLRRTPFEPGQTRQYRVLTDAKVYDLTLRVGASEPVKLDRYGAVPSVRVEPEAAFNGLFQRKGKLTLWVSQDERRLCTRMVGEVPVASVRITLAEVRGPGQDAWVKVPAKD
mgnify:CR=1 FL=1